MIPPGLLHRVVSMSGAGWLGCMCVGRIQLVTTHDPHHISRSAWEFHTSSKQTLPMYHRHRSHAQGLTDIVQFQHTHMLTTCPDAGVVRQIRSGTLRETARERRSYSSLNLSTGPCAQMKSCSTPEVCHHVCPQFPLSLHLSSHTRPQYI